MNYGDVYVASTAVYSFASSPGARGSGADPFNGPSVVLAYLPYTTEETPALEILKGNNASCRCRYWPLYCWNPAKEGNEPFSLDSDSVKNELQAFLDRQIHLSQLVRSKPDFCGARR